MPFRLRQDARQWLRDIRPAMSLDFDMYYLCLMAGLTVRQKRTIPNDETTELVDTFPGAYRQRGRLLVAAFLVRELQDLGVAMDDKSALHNAIGQYVDPLSPSYLSDQGLKQFNAYSYGGFDVMLEWFDDRPRAVETFLPLYHQKLHQHHR